MPKQYVKCPKGKCEKELPAFKPKSKDMKPEDAAKAENQICLPDQPDSCKGTKAKPLQCRCFIVATNKKGELKSWHFAKVARALTKKEKDELDAEWTFSIQCLKLNPHDHYDSPIEENV